MCPPLLYSICVSIHFINWLHNISFFFNILSRILRTSRLQLSQKYHFIVHIRVSVYYRSTVSCRGFTMKLSVIVLTFGFAILANGDYTNPHWQNGLLIFLCSTMALTPSTTIKITRRCRQKCHGSFVRMAMAWHCSWVWKFFSTKRIRWCSSVSCQWT